MVIWGRLELIILVLLVSCCWSAAAGVVYVYSLHRPSSAQLCCVSCTEYTLIKYAARSDDNITRSAVMPWAHGMYQYIDRCLMGMSTA